MALAPAWRFLRHRMQAAPKLQLEALPNSPARFSTLPASLANSRNLTLMGQLAEAVTADAELPHVCVRPTTKLTAVVTAHCKLRRKGRLDLE